jgi:bifunctional NMN adenylyltransferase/nudix hydrolase
MAVRYDIAVVIGRFQPIHNGHLDLFRKAFEIADDVVCILGSTHRPASIKNPLSYNERVDLIVSALLENDISVPYFRGVEDSHYQDQVWFVNVKNAVQNAVEVNLKHHLHGRSIAVVGHLKDASSYYLNGFADWDKVEVPANEMLHSTDIRNEWFSNNLAQVRPNLAESVYRRLKEKNIADLVEEYTYVKKYREETQVGPFPVQFLTTDAVVVHGDEILMVRRGMAPGKGLWALPGGFKGHKETFFDSCVRELQEETNIDLPESTIRRAKREEKIFDFPDRSVRGTTVSMAYSFILDPTMKRPRVKAADDAVLAWWFPLAELRKMRDKIFEDHLDMIEYMVARV